MYQFYYAEPEKREPPLLKKNIINEYHVTSVRPAVWEEHCLECSAPLCFGSCPNYEARRDGRCHRFYNSISTFKESRALNGQGAHIRFRKWANLMTVIYPDMLAEDDYASLNLKNEKLGNFFHSIIYSRLPKSIMWQSVRIPEYLRRRSMKKKVAGDAAVPDAFILHCYSFEKDPFRLVMEVYEEHEPKYRTSFEIAPGENFSVLDNKDFNSDCSKVGNVIKIYPENDREADMEFYWCDFVKGYPVGKEQPAEKVKCVVWDLDNTLWDGTLIETDDPGTLKLRPGVYEAIKALDERGIIQSVSSKNEFKPAFEILEKLGISEYILYPQISWSPKSEAIKEIARLLNIGIDSFAFFDDSAFERNEVKSALPQVRVYGEKDIFETVNTAPFDVIVTDESRVRRTLYRAEEKRNTYRVNRGCSPVEFLKDCNLEISIFEPETDNEITRCFELLQRTNQLNMSGRKYTYGEFSEILSKKGYKSFAFSCKDNFGDYGIVGFGQYRVEGQNLIFSEYAMSCRVAGKYIESALFLNLLEKENCIGGKFVIIKTSKNALLRGTLDEIGFRIHSETNESVIYLFGADLKNAHIVKAKDQR